MATTSLEGKIMELCKNSQIRQLFLDLLDTVSGHDHDGTNSKAVGNGYVTLTGVETLTNKTLTSPVLNTAKIGDGDTHLSVTSANQTHATPTATIPDIIDNADEFVMKDTAQT